MFCMAGAYGHFVSLSAHPSYAEQYVQLSRHELEELLLLLATTGLRIPLEVGWTASFGSTRLPIVQSNSWALDKSSFHVRIRVNHIARALRSDMSCHPREGVRWEACSSHS